MINIAQILSECPKNTKLYSPIFGDVYLYSTSPNHSVISVTLNEGGKSLEQFLCDGKYTQMGECMLFPSKEQRDWSKFQIPFKDGDIIYTKHKLGTEFVSIFQREYERDIITYWDINLSTNKLIGSLHEGNAFKVFIEKDKVKEQRFATEEEKQKLFKAFKDNGYTWNTETKTLEKLIQPKFKVGDKVRHKNNHNVVFTIISIEEDSYVCGAELALWFDDQDKYELIHEPKFTDGDIVALDTEKGAQLFIFKENIYNYDYVQCYMMLDCGGEIDFEIGDYYVERFATKEEKQKLFKAIKDNGYKWNPETKTLEKLVKLEFEIDDWVVFNNHPEKGNIYQVKDTHNYEYTLQHILGGSMPIPFS